jgi:hypothetical protein
MISYLMKEQKKSERRRSQADAKFRHAHPGELDRDVSSVTLDVEVWELMHRWTGGVPNYARLRSVSRLWRW